MFLDRGLDSRLRYCRSFRKKIFAVRHSCGTSGMFLFLHGRRFHFSRRRRAQKAAQQIQRGFHVLQVRQLPGRMHVADGGAQKSGVAAVKLDGDEIGHAGRESGVLLERNPVFFRQLEQLGSDRLVKILS